MKLTQLVAEGLDLSGNVNDDLDNGVLGFTTSLFLLLLTASNLGQGITDKIPSGVSTTSGLLSIGVEDVDVQVLGNLNSSVLDANEDIVVDQFLPDSESLWMKVK